MDTLPQLPQLAFKKLGQRKLNRYAMPQLPQLAPTVFNMNRMEKRRRGVCDVRAENYIRAKKTVYATQPCNNSTINFYGVEK